MHARRFEALDSWRGLCACMVALFHFNVFSHIQSARIVQNAYLFVDFFFVLSGFVIAANYQARLAQGFGSGRFLFLRIGRIYPLHLVTMALFMPIDIAKDGVSLQLLRAVVTNALLLHGAGINSGLWLNFPSWSVSTEFVAYVVFALVTPWLGPRMLPWIVIAVAGSAILVFVSPLRMDSTYDYGLARCLYGFALGVLCFGVRERFLWLDKPLDRAADTLVEGTTVILLCLCLTMLDGHSAAAVATPVLFAGLVLLFAREKGFFSRALKVRPLLLIGALSYSIYMVHAFVRAVARAIAMALEKTTDLSFFMELPALANGEVPRLLSIGSSLWLGDALQVLMLLATVCLAVLTFRYIEEPGRLWSRGPRPFARHREGNAI